MSNFSEYDRSLFGRRINTKERSNSNNLSVAENISHFIDSHSSSKSDLSFRSDVEHGRYGSSSTRYEKESKSTALVYPTFNSSLKVFLNPRRFKEQFVRVCQDQLEARYDSLSLRELWGLEKLFTTFKEMQIDHPFDTSEALEFKGLETLESITDRWIFEREQYKNLVFSLDFLYSHVSFVLIFIFYWVHFHSSAPSPLVPKK